MGPVKRPSCVSRIQASGFLAPRLIDTLRVHTATCQPTSQRLRYLNKNRNRMRYPIFRTQGSASGFGVVESGCRSLVDTRSKQSGMRPSTKAVGLEARCLLTDWGHSVRATHVEAC